MESSVLIKMFEFAKSGADFFLALKSRSEEELKNAIEKSKATGGDTTDLERVLNGK